MNMTSTTSKIIAAMVVAALISLGIPMTMGSAQTVIGVVDSQAIADIDTNRTVDLTIIKTPGNPYDDGTAPTIAGVSFTIKRVQGIDLTTEAGWATAREISVPEAQQRGYTHEFTARTNAQGEASFTGLPIGLYLVSETPVPVAGRDTPVIVDFLITLPTGDSDGQSWNYNVFVKAKSEEVASFTPTPPRAALLRQLPRPHLGKQWLPIPHLPGPRWAQLPAPRNRWQPIFPREVDQRHHIPRVGRDWPPPAQTSPGSW